MTSLLQTMTSSSFFEFIGDLEQSGSQSLDAILTLSSITAFYPAKAENIIKKSLTQTWYYGPGKKDTISA